MFSSLLIPLDGSKMAEASLPVAEYLARKLGAGIKLLHVIERDAPEEIHGERHLRSAKEAQEYLDETAQRFIHEGIQANCFVEEVEASDVASSITGYAMKSSTELVVMCTHGHGGLRHLLMGSNAQQILGCGCVPVLQVRPEWVQKEIRFDELLIPMDGIPEHESGFLLGIEMAEAIGAKAHLLMAVPTLSTLRGESAAVARFSPGAASEMLEIRMQEADDYIQSKISTLHSQGLEVAGEVLRGDPVRVILDTASTRGSGMIVLGTHRKAGSDAFWSGSVAPKVTNHSIVPILLVPVL